MQSQHLQTAIVDYTARVSSRHVERRDYIGLSGIADCERVIYDRYMFGDPHQTHARLKDALGYDLETALIQRLTALELYRPAPAIYLFDGLVQGHPDGEVGGDLLEIKTVPMESYIPEYTRLPVRVFYQVQAYLAFTSYQHAHVVYLARDTGAIRVIGLTRSAEMGFKIEQKIFRLVEAVRANSRPDCTCNRCRPDRKDENR
jgi:hypothetical protein